jgi:class 3 adenylate cyclase
LRIVSGLEAVPGFPPVRVGMHTGPAVGRDRDWYGATVNVAARLCAAAGGGEVLVGESTLKAAGRMRKVRLTERRLHWLKNVTEPVPAHVASERPCPSHAAILRPLVPGAREVMP